MVISHIGHIIVSSPFKNLHLNEILHVHTASKNLLFVHRIALDNNVFLEFHPFYFFTKDRVTRRILHHGRCVGSLYPSYVHRHLPPSSKPFSPPSRPKQGGTVA